VKYLGVIGCAIIRFFFNDNEKNGFSELFSCDVNFMTLVYPKSLEKVVLAFGCFFNDLKLFTILTEQCSLSFRLVK
jgi:hypothetical protein